MSQIYSTEPVTEGKVLLHTSLGDIDIELWSKQAPKTCRNFLSLCLSGSLDDTRFDRVLKDFLVQHQGNPEDDASSVGPKPEYHPRIRFNHRGQVAMVKGSASKFFITLDTADHLYQKCTIFGKVTGPTMFNVLRMGNIATDDNECPEHPVTLTSVEVLSNPFEDLVIVHTNNRHTLAEEAAAAAAAKSQMVARKSIKNTGMLSFGPGADSSSDSDDDGNGSNRGKPPVLAILVKSSHDVDERPKKRRKKNKDKRHRNKERVARDEVLVARTGVEDVEGVAATQDATTEVVATTEAEGVEAEMASSSLADRLGRFKKMNPLDLEDDEEDDY
jgi:peptidyl-prolyl cis-trans isomerase SDCCAG10